MVTLQSEHNSSNIKRLDKLHNPNNPIRPTVNWQNRLARFFSNILQSSAPLPYSFNIKNTIQLLHDCQEINTVYIYNDNSVECYK